MGPTALTAGLARNLRDRGHLYDPESHDLKENLERILEIKFPKPAEEDGEDEEEYNVECCICYAHRLGEEEGKLPEKFCSGSNCGKAFHLECLVEYLKGGGGGDGYTLVGKCPYCEEDISCKKLL